MAVFLYVYLFDNLNKDLLECKNINNIFTICIISKEEKIMEENKNNQNFFADHLPAIISLGVFVFAVIARICILAKSYTASSWLYFIGTICAFTGICWKMILQMIDKKFSFDIDFMVCLVSLAVAIL